MFVSSGQLIRNGILWQGTTADEWPTSSAIGLGGLWFGYGEMYKRQLWVTVVVEKRAKAVARLPLKVYLRTSDGREDARKHPYAVLLRRPHPRLDPFMFWQWVSSTYDVFGESFLGKQRDAGGRPIALIPLHPTKMRRERNDAGVMVWKYRDGTRDIEIADQDLIHFQTYHPDTLDRGMSKLEPLRDTLENEHYARLATSSFWRRGARPGVALTHPNTVSAPAAQRLKVQWDSIAGGADNTGATVVLEEGMKPEILTVTSEEAQYIETRKLNREEVCAAYDVPPPVVHILDRATFSNITEQMRSMYRDTMGPHLGYFEAVLEQQLRASVRPGASSPDFGDEVYAEFLLDEVLRGSFEARQEAYRNADYMTIAEKRARENLPFIPGTDRIVINAASLPLDMLDVVTAARAPGVSQNTARTLMGRLGWQQSLDEIDPAALVAGLNGDTETVLAALNTARAAGEDVPTFRRRLREMETA